MTSPNREPSVSPPTDLRTMLHGMAPERAGRAAGRLAALAIVAIVALALVAEDVVWNPDDAWTLFLFLVACALPLWCCFRRFEAEGHTPLDLLQPGALVAPLFFLYTIVPAFHVWHDLDYQSAWLDPTWPAASLFQFTFVLSVLGLAAFGIGYRWSTYQSRQTAPAPTLEETKASWSASSTTTAILMLAIGLPFRLHHLAALGGLSRDILLFLSPTYVVESGLEIGGVPTLFESFFDWGALLLVLRAIVTRKHRFVSLCVLLVALLLAYLESGKRSAVVPFLLYPIVWVHYLKRRITLKRGLVYATIGSVLVTVLLFMRTVGPLLATTGVTLATAPTEVALAPAQFYINSPELAVFDMTMLAVQDRASLLHEIGGVFWGGLRYNLLPVLYVIPRAIWPGKPIYSNLGAAFYQHAVGGQNVGFAVGMVGGLYLFGGVIGVLLGMMILGVLFRATYEWLKPWRRNFRNVFLYGITLWMVFHLLRFGELGGPIVFFYQSVLPGVIVALLVLKPPRRPGMTFGTPSSTLPTT